MKCEAVLYREQYMLKYNFISYLMEGKNYIHWHDFYLFADILTRTCYAKSIA